MKISLCFLLFIFFLEKLNAQVNLCGNSSFEIYDSCVTNENQIHYATGWRNFCGTPDYFDSCSINPDQSVPYNINGSYQLAATGSAYSGFFSYWSSVFSVPESKEHIGRQLDSTLIIGKKYFVSFKVSLAVNPWSLQCATNNLGIKFSTVPYDSYATDSITSPLINNFAHVYTSLIVSDSINWTTVSGSFIADSAYNYLVIGNFFKDANTDTLLLYPSTNPYCYAYYYVDDIVVMRDTVNGMNQIELQNSIQIYSLSNAVILNFSNHLSLQNCYLTIYDAMGRELKKDKITDYQFTIETNTFSQGIYFLKLNYKDKVLTKKILIKN